MSRDNPQVHAYVTKFALTRGIFEVDAERVHRTSMTTIVPYLAAAMAARLDRGSNLAKGLGLAFRKIEQAIMRRVKPARDREAALDLDRDRMTELHAGQLHEVSTENDAPPRQIVDKEGPAGRQYANTLVEPAPTPIDIFGVRPRIVCPVPVGLAQIEGRVGKHRIDQIGLEPGQVIETIALEKQPLIG